MSTLTKSELIAQIQNQTRLKTTDVELLLTSFLDAAGTIPKAGGEILLLGFGTFGVTESKAREGSNPRTGETINIKVAKRPSFKAGKPERVIEDDEDELMLSNGQLKTSNKSAP
jgi:DNA-binding protein HU-beta